MSLYYSVLVVVMALFEFCFIMVTANILQIHIGFFNYVLKLVEQQILFGNVIGNRSNHNVDYMLHIDNLLLETFPHFSFYYLWGFMRTDYISHHFS